MAEGGQLRFIIDHSPDFISLINSDYVYEFANAS